MHRSHIRDRSTRKNASSPKDDKQITGTGATKLLESPVKNSAAVVREARLWSAIQPVSTERPSTPKDSQRYLFGGDGPGKNSRPPSAFSIGAHNFDASDPSSRPTSARAPHPPKLSPLDHVPIINAELLNNSSSSTVPKTGKIPKPLILDQTDLALKKSRNRIALRHRNYKQAAPLPIKALPATDKVITPPSASRYSHSAGYVTSESNNLRENTLDLEDNKRAHSASNTINVDLTSLTIDRSEAGNISSSSSASSFDKLSAKSRSGNHSSDGKDIEETAEQAFYWNKNVLPLMENLEKSNVNVEELLQNLYNLYDILILGNCITNMSGRRRTSLLSTLFRFLTKGSAKISLACARIILAVKVRKVNFVSISKVIFKISREDGNDKLFLDHNLVEIIISLFSSMTNILEKYDAVIYLVGSIKIWSNVNESLAKKLIACNAIEVLMSLCSNLVSSIQNHDTSKKSLKLTADIMVQLTATLRNLAEFEREKFLDKNFFMCMNYVLMLLGFDANVVLNVSRIFSKFTLYGDVVNTIFADEEWETKYALNSIYQHMSVPNIVTRLCFVLSNIASKNETARIGIYFAQEPKGDEHSTWCMKILNKAFDTYLSQVMDEKTSKNASEVLNKLISVIANLSITEEIGDDIACNKMCILYMIKLLEFTNINENEELISNTLTTFNNLSYYKNDKSYINKFRMQISKHLFGIIISSSMICVAESVKVFGNLSQFSDVKEYLKQNKGDQFMVTLLDSHNAHVVYSACGVLINMSTNPANRAPLITEGIVGKLLDILKELAPLEWRIGGVVCQLLWNMCDEIATNSTSDEIDSIFSVLDFYLQEEAPQNILDTSNWTEDMLELNMTSWELDFVPFGNRIIDKLSRHHSQLVPLKADE